MAVAVQVTTQLSRQVQFALYESRTEKLLQDETADPLGKIMSRVLIIDDDAQMRRLLHQALSRRGHIVDEAVDGLHALHRFAEKPSDLVITDIIMPEREGIETIRELRHKCPELPIIAISGGGREGPQNYLSLALAMGASRSFSKPFRIEEILTAVQELTRSVV